MRDTHHLTLKLFAGVVLLTAVGTAGAQSASTDTARAKVVTVIPGAKYRAGAFERAMLGSGWRDVWTTPVQAPLLSIDNHAGGLKLKERGGGFHSIVLHLDEQKGWREYRFRSVDKFPMQGLPDALEGTTVGKLLFEDQVSVFFPAAPLLLPPLLRSVGVLHVDPDLYVMGDSPQFKELRDTVVGMLGTFELKAEEAPDDKPGFAGSTSIKGTEKLFDDLTESRDHRVDEREFLAARFIDFIVNDPDRTPDNWDWARFGEKGAYSWRPLPRDRDQAFIDARGLLNQFLIRRFYPKQLAFNPNISLKGLTYTTHQLDRRLLQRLNADDFRDVALRVQRAVHDSVIAQVVAEIPAEWRARTSADERVTSVLRARRENLPDFANRFYRSLAREVDVYGTDEADRISVVRHRDGRLSVVITDPEPATVATVQADGRVVMTSNGSVESAAGRGAYFSRTFLPGETKEVRLYANGGNDVAVVSGLASDGIKVRLIGGKGDDFLADSTGGSGTFLYDAEGANTLVRGDETNVDTRLWKPLPARPGFRVGGDWVPDWGGSSGWKPVIDYHTGSGVIVGVGPRFKSYGFRRIPYHWNAGANLMVGTESGRLGFTMDADFREENSPRAFRLEARATELEATRFFGYGNTTPDVGGSLVDQTEVVIEPTLVRHIGWRTREGGGNPVRGNDSVSYQGLRPLVGELRLGSVVGWYDPRPEPGSPLVLSGADGSESFGFAAAVAGFELDRTDADAVPTSGWTLSADVAAYPALLELDKAFATGSAGGTFYLPLGPLGGPHLAFRAGGSLASTGYPVQFAPAIGGRRSLRGFAWHRFAGDAAVSGSAEVRVPVGTVNFLIRSQMGVFALADAGRVWFDGDSGGGLHSGFGGGVWFAALGRSVSLAYAHGESHKFYVKSGLSY
ncbi:MAG: hypothetical protein ACRENU_11465 [Gemmatimonadaceae bacterium]